MCVRVLLRNINLQQTGRLSCRRPNLQNQPALEKDRYRVRQAFRAAPGKKLIVADYGQLELRLLAHVSNCQSMIDGNKQSHFCVCVLLTSIVHVSFPHWW